MQVGFDVQKESRVTKALLGDFKKAGSDRRNSSANFASRTDAPEGEINLAVTHFQAGDCVDVDRPVEGQRFPGRREEAQFAMARARRTVP